MTGAPPDWERPLTELRFRGCTPHCHYSIELASGYRTFNYWPTEADARHAAEHLYGEPDAKMIAMHVQPCMCPEKNGAPA